MDEGGSDRRGGGVRGAEVRGIEVHRFAQAGDRLRGPTLTALENPGQGVEMTVLRRKLARSFGLTTAHTNLDLVESTLSIHDAPAVPPSRVMRSVRIGLREHATTTKPWRLYVRGSPGVSRP